MKSPAPPEAASVFSRAAKVFGRLNLLGRLSLLVDHRVGQLRQRFVGVLLLRQRGIEQPDGFIEIELLGPALEGSIAGDLVVLDGLRRRDQAGIESRRP